jgi:hypothetical protein
MLEYNSESRMPFDYNDKVVDSLKEIIVVYSYNYMKSVNIFFGQNADICCVSRFDARNNSLCFERL